uniref:Uncharacterized protein n=1 Tax=Pyramimonas obovata TaxID=1411642 RepID=A0A7S0R0D2_9CHLO
MDPEVAEEAGGVVDDEPATGVLTGVAGSLGFRRARPCPQPSRFRFGAGDGVVALGDSAMNALDRLDGASLSACCFSVALEARSSPSSFAFSELFVLIGGGFGEIFDSEGGTSVVFKAVAEEGSADDGADSV